MIELRILKWSFSIAVIVTFTCSSLSTHCTAFSSILGSRCLCFFENHHKGLQVLVTCELQKAVVKSVAIFVNVLTVAAVVHTTDRQLAWQVRESTGTLWCFCDCCCTTTTRPKYDFSWFFHTDLHFLQQLTLISICLSSYWPTILLFWRSHRSFQNILLSSKYWQWTCS